MKTICCELNNQFTGYFEFGLFVYESYQWTICNYFIDVGFINFENSHFDPF